MSRDELTRRTAMQIVAGSLVTASGCASLTDRQSKISPAQSVEATGREPLPDREFESPETAAEPATPDKISSKEVTGRLYFVYYPRDDQAAFQRVTTAIRKPHGAWQRYGGDVAEGISMPSRVLAWIGPEAVPELRTVAARVAPFDARHSPARIDPAREDPYLCATGGTEQTYRHGAELTVVLAPNSWRHVPNDVTYHSTEVVAEQLSAMLSDYPVEVGATLSIGWRGQSDLLTQAVPPGLLKIQCAGVPSRISTIIQSHPQVLGTELSHHQDSFFDGCPLCGMG